MGFGNIVSDALNIMRDEKSFIKTIYHRKQLQLETKWWRKLQACGKICKMR